MSVYMVKSGFQSFVTSRRAAKSTLSGAFLCLPRMGSKPDKYLQLIKEKPAIKGATCRAVYNGLCVCSYIVGGD